MIKLIEAVMGISEVRPPGGPDIDRVLADIKKIYIEDRADGLRGAGGVRMTPEQAESAWQQAIPRFIAALEMERNNPRAQQKLKLRSTDQADAEHEELGRRNWEL